MEHPRLRDDDAWFLLSYEADNDADPDHGNEGGGKAKDEESFYASSAETSDLSGKQIDDPKDAAKVTITYGDARRGAWCSMLASEVEDWAGKGARQARRGRKPKDAS